MPGPSPDPADPAGATDYRMAPALAVTTVGRGLVALGVLVVLATLFDVVAGTGPVSVLVVFAVGLVVLGGRAWWLLRRWALRLTGSGYDVRGLRGIGVRRATWSEVESAAAVEASGTPYLVLRLHDGRTTALPMSALAVDREVVAGDVQRRLRDGHTPGRDGAEPSEDPDSAPADDSL